MSCDGVLCIFPCSRRRDGEVRRGRRGDARLVSRDLLASSVRYRLVEGKCGVEWRCEEEKLCLSDLKLLFFNFTTWTDTILITGTIV